jgi:hypothetical protein
MPGFKPGGGLIHHVVPVNLLVLVNFLLLVLQILFPLLIRHSRLLNFLELISQPALWNESPSLVVILVGHIVIIIVMVSLITFVKLLLLVADVPFGLFLYLA